MTDTPSQAAREPWARPDCKTCGGWGFVWAIPRDGGEKQRAACGNCLEASARPTEQAIRPEYEGEPVAWMHTLHMEGGQTCTRLREDDGTDEDEPRRTAFGMPGRDYSEEYPVTSQPLYAHPSSEQAIRADERVKALDEAALLVEKRRDVRFAEHGTTDPDTNASYYSGRHGETFEMLDEEDEEIVTAILALKTKGQGDAD
jgi:hypothetical protein